MILQALTRYYEDLLAQGEIALPGWTAAKVSYGLSLNEDGAVLQLLPLQDLVEKGKKKVLTPRVMEVPSPVKRTVGIAANFLCDNSGYLLGADDKGKPERTAKCFDAAKELHLKILSEADSAAARAVKAFFAHWNPALAAAHPALQESWEELMKGGNILFWYDGRPVSEDPAVREAWQRQYESGEAAEAASVCLVTGQHLPPARLHPSIKGVAGAQSSGASLVSFNAPAFCSYGHEQGLNAPTSAYAARAYTTALNHLLSGKHVCRIGDTTAVFWAEGGEKVYQDCVQRGMFDDSDYYSADELLDTLKNLANGRAVDWDGGMLDPDTCFYILGLAPNAARLSVRFFWQNTFGTLARNVLRHYERLEIVRPSFDGRETLPVKSLLRETVNLNARTPEPEPRLAGDLLLAILNDTLYPATLLYGVSLRIRAEQKVTRGRAAIIKAYYKKNSRDANLKEVMTVELNEQTNYLPYLLGRLFSVLEAVQQAANPGINTTIKDRYFNAASATPASVFPLLLNLAQKHLAKLDKGKAVYYEKQITGIVAKMDAPFPNRMSLSEQGAFQIGYYHETQRRYTKKEEQ